MDIDIGKVMALEWYVYTNYPEIYGDVKEYFDVIADDIPEGWVGRPESIEICS